MSEEFARHLRERAAAVVPEISVETAAVVPRAKRRRALTRAIAGMGAVALVGGVAWGAASLWPGRTTSPVPPAVDVTPVPAEQRAGLLGTWRVTAPSGGAPEWLRLGAAGGTLWRDCGLTGVWWDAGPTRLVAYVGSWEDGCSAGASAEPVTWLDAVVYYRAAGDGWSLLDARGDAVATLDRGTPPPDVEAALRGDPGVYEPAAWLADPAAVPTGLAAATEAAVLGRWEPEGSPVANDPYVELRGDGTWEGSDGCNVSGGRFAVDRDGRFLVVSGGHTDLGCEGAPLPDLLVTARRLALDGDTLVLLDQDAATVARLAPAVVPLEVECTASGIAVSSDTVTATTRGVPLLVANTGAEGQYLHYRWNGTFGGGDPAPSTPTRWYLQAPPGDLVLECGEGGGAGPNVRVRVVDPEGYWATGTPEDLGCRGNGVAEWVFSPEETRAATAPEALEKLAGLMRVAWPDGAQHVPSGYPGAAQTWLFSRDGAAYVTVTVSQVDGGYQAYPDRIC